MGTANAIAGYHADPIRSQWPDPTCGDVGVECEIEFHGGVELDEVGFEIRRTLPLAAVEYDGSLGNGLEVVFPPMPSGSIELPLRRLCGVLEHFECYEDKPSAGVHLSMCACRISSPHGLGRFIQVLSDLKQSERFDLFGRTPTSYCQVVPGSVADKLEYVDEGTTLIDILKAPYDASAAGTDWDRWLYEKYYEVANRGNFRTELRMLCFHPEWTVLRTRVRRLLEAVDACRQRPRRSRSTKWWGTGNVLRDAVLHTYCDPEDERRLR